MAKSKNETVTIDKGAKRIRKVIGEVKRGKPHVDAGYWGAKKHPDGDATVAMIAAVNEYGSSDGTVPERTYMRRVARDNRREWQKDLAQIGVKVIRGADLKGLLVAFGERVMSAVRVRLTKGDPSWKGLADSTIKARRKRHPTSPQGGEQPLFDTGFLASAGGTRVVMRGSKVAETGNN